MVWASQFNVGSSSAPSTNYFLSSSSTTLSSTPFVPPQRFHRSRPSEEKYNFAKQCWLLWCECQPEYSSLVGGLRRANQVCAPRDRGRASAEATGELLILVNATAEPSDGLYRYITSCLVPAGKLPCLPCPYKSSICRFRWHKLLACRSYKLDSCHLYQVTIMNDSSLSWPRFLPVQDLLHLYSRLEALCDVNNSLWAISEI